MIETSMSKGERIRGENQFIERGVVGRVAEMIADQIKAKFSEPRYGAANKTIGLRWLPSFKFEADARVEDDNTHLIAISYGAAYETYRDAFVLPQVCQKTLTDPFYDPLFDLLSYGNDRKDVLPAGLSPEKARSDGVMMGITWLYCHEQAHLFQAHGEIATALGAGVLDKAGGISEADDAEPLVDRDAAVRHVFELCADHEATAVALKELTPFGTPVEQASLWLFVVTLCCMFQRMSGTIDRPLPLLAEGTHPHPAFRMRMAVQQIKAYFADPLVCKRMGSKVNPEALERLLDHAVTTAAVYWHMRYRDDHALPLFLQHVQDPNPVPPTYRDQIFKMWQEIEPLIADRYMGWETSYRLQLAGPQSLG